MPAAAVLAFRQEGREAWGAIGAMKRLWEAGF